METSALMTSPTGLGIRNDTEGQGYYRAKRGKRLHAGVDYKCKPGKAIFSPISGKIKRIAYPYPGKEYQGVVIESEFFTIKLFYFKPFEDLIGQEVKKGEHIGFAQDISLRYSEFMLPHVHLQIERVDPNIFIGA